MTADRALRTLTIAVAIAFATIGLALPHSIVLGGMAWLVALFLALSGWGWLVTRVAQTDDVDFGLRTAWGVAAYLGVAGVLVMVGLCSRGMILGLVAIGLAGFGWRELVTPEPIADRLRAASAFVRARPLVAALAIAGVLVAAIVILGAIVQLERNPWDDDLAYTPFVRRLLDTGDLIEPFSFRRLAAYGGQTALQALGAARGNLAAVHLVDHGLCFGLVLMLVVGHARARTPALWLGLTIALLLLLPDISINTASYWSGAAGFLALYRTIEQSDERPRTAFAIAALVAAATCTLRHSYLPVVVLFLGFVAGSRLVRAASESSWREAWRAEWRRWKVALAVVLLALVPWCLAAFSSSRTFLFPLMQGTWNHGLSLDPSAWTWTDSLSHLIASCLEVQPIAVGIVFALLAPFVVDPRPGRPMTSMFVAAGIGFLLLVHGFGSADAMTLWRYAFGYTLPLVLVLALEASADPAPIRVTALGRWVLLAALVIQIGFARTGVVKRYAGMFRDLRDAIADGGGAPEREVERERYAAMQASVPAGERLAVMVDDPAYLDFNRNPIANLDTPGFASPGTQLPSFNGAEAMRAYLLDEGYRYAAFVKSDRSRYFFRRGFWMWRLFNDAEIFQAMSAYAIDAIDNFATLAGSSRVLYDDAGLVVLDLEAHHKPALELDPADESLRRDDYVRKLAVHEGLFGEWRLSSRSDIVIEDGLNGITYLDPAALADPHWNDAYDRAHEPTTGTPVKWMQRRVHWRVKGDRAMHLMLRGHVNLNALYSRPRLDVSLDGELIASTVVDLRGNYIVDVVVPVELLDGWCDLYAVWNTIGQPEKDVKDLRIARLEELVWEPR